MIITLFSVHLSYNPNPWTAAVSRQLTTPRTGVAQSFSSIRSDLVNDSQETSRLVLPLGTSQGPGGEHEELRFLAGL